MIPKPPPREPTLGFLYFPPYRVQGISIAGEQTCVMVPELDLCFDIGNCPRASLSSKFLAISHGHMDHIGGLAYWCSQRNFQGMGPGTIVCPTALEAPIREMMAGYERLEDQKTPYEIVTLDFEESVPIKNSMELRCIELDHRVPAGGYVVIERRTKLKEEFQGLPQEKLRELKDRGTEITNKLQIPLIAYLSDTAPGQALLREDVRKAQIVIAECTFVDPDHVGRAEIGKHMHLNHITEWMPLLEGEALVLIHLSRRSNIAAAKKRLRETLPRDQADRIHFLMDYGANRKRYETQTEDAERRERQRAAGAQ